MKKDDIISDDATISGERIRSLRKELNLTQAELAEKLGVKDSAVAKYENGRVTNIKRSVIKKMADLFNVSPSYIMGYPEDETNKNLKTLPFFSKETIDNLMTAIPSTPVTIYSDLHESDDVHITVNSLSDVEKALKLYEQYKKASPRDRSIVDSLLKPPLSDS